MTKEFEPYTILERSTDFNVWDYAEDTVATEGGVELVVDSQVTQLELLRQEAMDRGYAEGLAKAEEEIAQQKASLMSWITLLQKPVAIIDEALVQEMIQVIIWLSHYCIGIELSVHQDKLTAIIEEVKNEIPIIKGRKELWMNAEDVEWLKKQVGDAQYQDFLAMLHVDETLGRGDFYLKTSHSELDGRLNSRLVSLFANHLDKDNLVPLPSGKAES